MLDSFMGIQRPLADGQFSPTLPCASGQTANTHKIVTNFILKEPPRASSDLDSENLVPNGGQISSERQSQMSGSDVAPKENLSESSNELGERVPEEPAKETRVKGKVNRKVKRDGENIRTYARYDSVIQALEEELALNKIIPTAEDNKILEKFEMKSKRSLERFFFYLLLAKRENKLCSLLPELKNKILTKVQEKGGHRTPEFLASLHSCIERYIKAAESLSECENLSEAKKAFAIAYFDNDFDDTSSNSKRPHHNKVKGVEKCVGVYEIIMKGQLEERDMERSSKMSFEQNSEQDKNSNNFIEQKKETSKNNSANIHSLSKRTSWNRDNKDNKDDDESFNIDEEEDFFDNPGERRRKVGTKSKKQDERDIQKYAKFDIVSESCLEFLKKEKLYKNIPESFKKLSHRSLHFFFLVLALVQKKQKEEEFLSYLESNYQKKVQKRYTQRSEYFRERLYSSFNNLVEATGKLLKGHLDEALDIAYEVNSEKKPHPAKACQQKKCKEIYLYTQSYAISISNVSENCFEGMKNKKFFEDSKTKNLFSETKSSFETAKQPSNIFSSVELSLKSQKRKDKKEKEENEKIKEEAWIQALNSEKIVDEEENIVSPHFSQAAMEEELPTYEKFECLRPCISGRSGSIETSSGLWEGETVQVQQMQQFERNIFVNQNRQNQDHGENPVNPLIQSIQQFQSGM